MPQGSKIFLPNRALGYVSNHVPLQVRYIRNRKENLITTSVGKQFHTYGMSHFALLSVSGLHHADITCMSADAYHVYTACDTTVYAWRRGTELKHTYRGHGAPVHLLMPFAVHLVSVDEANVVRVWDVKSEELFLELRFPSASFRITALLHPSTYLNKVLLGSEQAGLQLWNIHTSKLIHTFAGWGSAVTCLEQAPALDVAAVGLANGRILLHNLRYDETVLEFTQDWGRVTALSFRTDGRPIMASGTPAGHIVLWNLEERRVDTQLMAAHDGPVSGLQCLANEPLMVTSAPDNTLKLWIFDMSDGGARLLRIREGHSAPPSCIRFHGANGQNVLSAAGDSTLRIFNTRTETFNKSLGRASYNRRASKRRARTATDPLRMPPIVHFATETTREKDWDNIAAVHEGLAAVSTWSYDRLRMGERLLLPERFQRRKRDPDVHVTATCACLTHCGHFVLVGYSTGHVDRFNVQSGVHRDTYGTPRAHRGPVRGLAVDTLNSLVVSAAGDRVKFWPFRSDGAKARTKLQLDEPVSFVRAHPDSSLLAVALEDFAVHILDVDTRTIVRKFHGHSAQLTDAAFSPDSRWLLTSSMDCTIKTWSIPAGQLVDQFRLDAACTSLALSPTGELLATAHVDSLGVFLWSNRTLYTRVTLRALSEHSEAPLVALPDCSREHVPDEDEASADTDSAEFKSPEQITNELVTLSTVASSRWQNLLNIDVIRQRNRPRAPPKVPAKAPFFLPTVPSLTFQFDLQAGESRLTDGRLLEPTTFVNFSPFAKLLDATTGSSFAPVIERLKGMGPSMIDFEIKLLGPAEGGSVRIMLQFLKCVESMFQSNRDFELAQAYLAVFLKSHGNTVAEEQTLREYLPNMQSCQAAGWARLQSKLLYNLCVIQSLKTM